MLLQAAILGSQNAMNAAEGATIGQRIRISQPDAGRGRCKGSRAWDPRKDFSQCMQQPTILSTSSAISPQQERTEPSGHRPCRHDVKSSVRREPDMLGDVLRALFGNVTEPFERKLRRSAVRRRKIKSLGIKSDVCLICGSDDISTFQLDYVAGRKHDDQLWPLCEIVTRSEIPCKENRL